MSSEPRLQQRAEQPYAGIGVSVTMAGLPGAVDAGFGELFGWLAERGVAPAGPPLIRYHVVDMDGELRIDLAVPVSQPVPASGRVRPGSMPAGRYLVLRHTGPYDGLVASNGAVQRWAAGHGIGFDAEDTAEGLVWRGRAEHYLTNPAEEPDPAKWEVDVAYLTNGG